MSTILCKKYGHVKESNCADCKDRDRGSGCSKFIMLSSSAERLGCIPRTDVRDALGEETTQVTVVNETASNIIEKKEEGFRRRARKPIIARKML